MVSGEDQDVPDAGWADKHAAVVDELRRLRERGIMQARSLELPHLLEAAQGAHPEIDNASRALEALLRRAVKSLGDDKIADVASLLLGVQPGTRGRRPSELRGLAAERWGVNRDTFRKVYEGIILNDVAAAVLESIHAGEMEEKPIGVTILDASEVNDAIVGSAVLESEPKRPRAFHVPLGSTSHFIGREDALAELRQRLASDGAAIVAQAYAITGLGGVGKTALAAQYARTYAADYDVIWWFRAESATTLAEDATALARAIGLPQADAAQKPEVVLALRRWLEDSGRWLLILDNAERFSDVASVLPQRGEGHVLITSRNPSWPQLAPTTVSLGVLSPADAVTFLLGNCSVGVVGGRAAG